MKESIRLWHGRHNDALTMALSPTQATIANTVQRVLDKDQGCPLFTMLFAPCCVNTSRRAFLILSVAKSRIVLTRQPRNFHVTAWNAAKAAWMRQAWRLLHKLSSVHVVVHLLERIAVNDDAVWHHVLEVGVEMWHGGIRRALDCVAPTDVVVDDLMTVRVYFLNAAEEINSM